MVAVAPVATRTFGGCWATSESGSTRAMTIAAKAASGRVFKAMRFDLLAAASRDSPRTTRRLARQQRQQCFRRRAQVAVAAMDGRDRIGHPHPRHVEGDEQALAQFVAHAALRHHGEAEAGLSQALLCRPAVG